MIKVTAFKEDREPVMGYAETTGKIPALGHSVPLLKNPFDLYCNTVQAHEQMEAKGKELAAQYEKDTAVLSDEYEAKLFNEQSSDSTSFFEIEASAEDGTEYDAFSYDYGFEFGAYDSSAMDLDYLD